MGLKDYRKFKREQELKESETISFLLIEIGKLKEEVENLKAQLSAPAINITDDEKKKIKMAQDGKTKPEDFIKLFTTDLEEFNPNA